MGSVKVTKIRFNTHLHEFRGPSGVLIDTFGVNGCFFLLGVHLAKKVKKFCSRAGMSNWWPAGRIQPHCLFTEVLNDLLNLYTTENNNNLYCNF